MIVVDTSAVIAILLAEPEAEPFLRAVIAADRAEISAGSALETAIVLERAAGESVVHDFERLLDETGVQVVPFDRDQLEHARYAFRHFGRGSGHAARLNFGDCFAYALAKLRAAPLLFKGTDFGRTDILRARAE
jgi:ribonuclease VapC